MTVRRWTDTARRLRRDMSLPEVLLWREIRLRADGIKFRRQHAIGDYVLDFYCAAGKLAVEIDGWAHTAGNTPARDEARDAWLAARGIRTIRVVATEVLADPAGVAIWLAAQVGAILSARGEGARSAGAGTDRGADVPGHGPPPSRFARHLPASGEDRQDQGPAPCR